VSSLASIAKTEQSAEISVSMAARIAGCSNDTVLRWIEEGAIEARRISPRGWWKLERKSLTRYLDRQAGKAEQPALPTPAAPPGSVERAPRPAGACEAHWSRRGRIVPALRAGLCRGCFSGRPLPVTANVEAGWIDFAAD
jgi:excisionase family DNA binding protein